MRKPKLSGSSAPIKNESPAQEARSRAAPTGTKESIDLAGLAPLHPGNVELFLDNGARRRLVIVIDCADEIVAQVAPSGSGKSRVLASTGGFAPVVLPGNPLPGLKLSVTATLPLE